MTSLIVAMVINMALVTGTVPTAEGPGVCGDAFKAQDEVIELQDSQIAKLKLQAAELQIVINSMNIIVASQDRTVAALAAENERLAAYARKVESRNRWERFFTGLQYGAVGFGLGVVADRAVWD